MKASAMVKHPMTAEAILRELVHAGTLAPSGDNLQPWRFEVDPERSRLIVHVDEERDLSPMNSGQRMSRIAVGAAVENVIQTAEYNDLNCRVDSIERTAVTLSVNTPVDNNDIAVPKVVLDRCTNRRQYDRRPVDAETLENAASTTGNPDGIQVAWVMDHNQIDGLASIVRKSDTLMFGNAGIRNAFLENVRLDRPATEPVEEGLALATLQAGPFDRFALRLLSRTPAWLADRTAGKAISKQSEKLVLSASGLCIGVALDAAFDTDFRVGRAMERAWLALTRCGMAVQPMMSLLVLQGALEHDSDRLSSQIDFTSVQRLLDEVTEIIPQVAEGRLGFIVRFGFAPPPAGRSGRRTHHA